MDVRLERDALATARVLVASHDPEARAHLEDVLRALGPVAHVEDGDTLLSAIERSEHDLVVYDARWPSVDAIQALRTLRARESALPVVLLYAHATGDLGRVEPVDILPNDVVVEPISGVELLARARTQLLLSRQRAALAVSEAELRQAFNVSSIGMVHIDPSTNAFLRVNRRFCELLGYTEAELLGRPVSDAFLAEDRASYAKSLDRLTRGEVTELRAQRRCLRQDGSAVWVHLTANLVRDERGRPVRVVALVEDVSERRFLEEELRASEERYRTLVEEAVDGIFVADAEGRFLEINGAGASMLGYERAELLGRRLGDELAASDARKLAEDRADLPVGSVLRRRWRFQRKDGSAFTGEVVCRRLENGRIQGILRDVTEREDAERINAFLVTVAEPVVVVNRAGRIEYANRQAHEAFGYDDGELAGQPHDVLIPERLRAAHAVHVERFHAAPEHRTMREGARGDLYGRRKDGTEFPIEVSLNPMTTSSGPMVSTVLRDVTHRKSAATAAALHAQRIASALESIPDPIALWDAADRLLAYNAAFAAFLPPDVRRPVGGMSYDAAVAAIERIATFPTPEVRDAVLAEVRTRRTGFSVDLLLADSRAFRFTGRPTPEGGRVVMAIDLTSDLRRERELEEARRDAEAANRAKTEFLASMSHELRTPLNAVLGFAQLLGRDKREPLSPRQREMVDRIFRGGEHLLRLVDDVLDLARIEVRSITVSPEPVALPEILREVIETLAPAAREQGVELVLDEGARTAGPVHVDRVRFVQVLMNFGTNAIKYNRPGGKVTFSVSPGAERTRVTLRDTGIGVPLREQGRLFQAFHRAGQETGSIPGTGIGLTIARRLAELMGGAVGFRSPPEGGSEFWVEVPRSRRRGSRPSSPGLERAMSPQRLEGARILYVDDSLASLELVAAALSVYETELLTAPTAEIGIEIARAQRPDLILMDVNLPGASGYEALAVLRGLPETKGIPVVALSAAASPAARERGLAAGFARYLTKPVRIEELEEALVAALGARR